MQTKQTKAVNVSLQNLNRLSVVLMSMFAVTCLSAQPYQSPQAPPTVHHPGDVVTITIAFDGVDAHKIQTATAFFNTPNVPKDQAGFTQDFAFSELKVDGPGILKLSYKILPNIASGVYRLIQIRAGTSGEGPISVMYTDGLPAFTMTIENDRHFVKPTIKSVKEP